MTVYSSATPLAVSIAAGLGFALVVTGRLLAISLRGPHQWWSALISTPGYAALAVGVQIANGSAPSQVLQPLALAGIFALSAGFATTLNVIAGRSS